ncbi:MAG: hypothetical protein RBS57_19785 [Desulforhabdus sp.]|jgi:uncharacterized protein (DUF779 family)|nr:hypothetical protein [Desulforhabdus sp.]
MIDERAKMVKELVVKASQLIRDEAAGCCDGFTGGSITPELLKTRAEILKTIEPKQLIERAKALKLAEVAGCCDGFTGGALPVDIMQEVSQ